MNVLILFFFFYTEAFKSRLDSLLLEERYAEALKIVEDSFKSSPNKLEFEKLRVYVLAYQGDVFRASNAYLRLYEVTGRHYPELLHWIAIGVFNTDNEKLARFLAYRLPLIHDIEAEMPLCRFIERLDNSKRPFFIRNLNKIADSNVFDMAIRFAREAVTYDEVFTISPLLSRLSICTGINVVDSLISSNSPYTRAIALWVAGDMRRPPSGLFEKYMKDRDPMVAMLATIGKLKHVPDPDVAILESYVTNPEACIRKMLAFHLGFFGTKGEKLLFKLLNDEDDAVKREAAKSLYYMGSGRALTPYVQAISYIDPRKKIWGIDNLALIADSSATFYVVKALNESPYPAVKVHAIWALATMGGSAARSVLASLLNSSNSLVKKEAALALGFMGDTRSIIQITRLARSQDPVTRKRALWILTRLGDRRGYKYLLKGLSDESLDVRVISALGLWRILNNPDRVKKE